MTIITTDVNLFQEVAKLPSEITAIIIGYLPKCILPKLLYFPLIKKEVASAILSDVNITRSIYVHKGSDLPGVGYSECDCDRFKIELTDLKKGIAQWNVYPRAIHIDGNFVFENILDTFPRLLKEALSINTTLSGHYGLDSETYLGPFFNSNIKFDSLRLVGVWDAVTLPCISTNVQVRNSILNSYLISGVKKLDIDMDSNDREIQTYAFSSELEDLQIKSRFGIQVSLPPNLRKLSITAYLASASFISEELSHLKYLQLKLPENQSFEETGIMAPNLKTLALIDCIKFSNLDNLKQFQHLKHLVLKNCAYPIGLLNESSFPELESFEYDGYGFEDPENFTDPLLIFPTNLKQLSIEGRNLVSIDFNALVLPHTLIRLHLVDLSFNDGYFHLCENLQSVHIKTSRLRFESSFKIPPMAEELILEADYLVFESLDFMYHLPNSLTRLSLIAEKQGRMSPIIQKIKWPLALGSFELEGFNIDQETLELLNLQESRLREIRISGGDIKRLDVDLFPVSVEYLTLIEMEIKELPASFERLKNLRKLTLMRNRLKRVNLVNLPVSSLEVLDISQCDLRLISPFVVSMFEKKNKKGKLRIRATGNLNVDANDVRKVIKAIKGLYLELNESYECLGRITRPYSRLRCIFRTFDPYFEKSESSETEEIVFGQDSNNLLHGDESVLDKKDNGTGNKRRKKR